MTLDTGGYYLNGSVCQGINPLRLAKRTETLSSFKWLLTLLDISFVWGFQTCGDEVWPCYEKPSCLWKDTTFSPHSCPSLAYCSGEKSATSEMSYPHSCIHIRALVFIMSHLGRKLQSSRPLFISGRRQAGSLHPPTVVLEKDLNKMRRREDRGEYRRGDNGREILEELIPVLIQWVTASGSFHVAASGMLSLHLNIIWQKAPWYGWWLDLCVIGRISAFVADGWQRPLVDERH